MHINLPKKSVPSHMMLATTGKSELYKDGQRAPGGVHTNSLVRILVYVQNHL